MDDVQKRIDKFLEDETERLRGRDANGEVLRECAGRVSAHVGQPVIVSYTNALRIVGYPLAASLLGVVPNDVKAAVTIPAPVAEPARVEVCACYTCGKPTTKPFKDSVPRCGKCT